jgi:hypothetical protein
LPRAGRMLSTLNELDAPTGKSFAGVAVNIRSVYVLEGVIEGAKPH